MVHDAKPHLYWVCNTLILVGLSPPLLLEVGFFRCSSCKPGDTGGSLRPYTLRVRPFYCFACWWSLRYGRNPIGYWRKPPKYHHMKTGLRSLRRCGLTSISPPAGVPLTERPPEITQPFGDNQVQSNAISRVQEHLRRTDHVQFT